MRSASERAASIFGNNSHIVSRFVVAVRSYGVYMLIVPLHVDVLLQVAKVQLVCVSELILVLLQERVARTGRTLDCGAWRSAAVVKCT